MRCHWDSGSNAARAFKCEHSPQNAAKCGYMRVCINARVAAFSCIIKTANADKCGQMRTHAHTCAHMRGTCGGPHLGAFVRICAHLCAFVRIFAHVYCASALRLVLCACAGLCVLLLEVYVVREVVRPWAYCVGISGMQVLSSAVRSAHFDFHIGHMHGNCNRIAQAL